MRRSLLADTASGAWLKQFGDFGFSGPDTIDVRSGVQVGDRFHAEAHHAGVLGADFAYSATLTADWTRPGLGAHLQFRISDEGRYGVRVEAGTIAFYRFMLDPRRCADDPTVIAHCPSWPEHGDDPIEHDLGSAGFDTTIPSLRVRVVAEGSRFEVVFGTASADLGRFETRDAELGVGRFGIYVRAPTPSLDVRFSELAAASEPTAASNFALLYSTPGYDVGGAKRALVRTLNDIEARDYDDVGSSFSVTSTAGDVKIPSRRFEAPGSGSNPRRTFGMQLLVADFSDLREVGSYVLEARVATSSGQRVLRSRPFEIRSRLVTETMLWPLSILNAQARRAADDDFRRNWFVESMPGAWSVGLDGAFVADRADDRAGAVLRRVFNIGNSPLSALDFRFVARITIVAGCDAQLQFRITDDERWAVTLQAGEAGGCPHGAGPGSVRLHREGPAVPGHFEAVDSHLMDGNPFRVGRAYDIEVRAMGSHVEVLLDGRPVIDFPNAVNPRPGGFALKAWGSTVRFGHAKVWARNVGLSRPAPGVWIPYDRATNRSSQGFTISRPDTENNGVSPAPHDLMNPFAAQQHGFHDCNNFIGEVTSHSVFLSALMDVWATRAHAVSSPEQEALRHAILTVVLYLNELFEQGNRSGAFTHQEPGRGALAVSDKLLTTQWAMYGLSSFAEKGLAVDQKHARAALDRAGEAWDWLDENMDRRDVVIDSIVAIRLARAAARQGLPAVDWFDRARLNAAAVLEAFGQPGALANVLRPTLRSIPWFEGVYEVFFREGLPLGEEQRIQLDEIVAQLMALTDDPANGFCVIPQADDDRKPMEMDPALPARNWNNLADLPLVVKPIPVPPVGDWYISNHFATAAADCVFIGRLAGEKALDRLATGNLHWILGLNPGIPTTKVVTSEPASGPWSGASFVYNGPGAFARTIEGHRTRTSAAKGWLADWEESTRSRHRETWWFDPANNKFQTIVNGHVLRESQWHYWSVGTAGWVSAETFMLTDGGFLKAALALEDWHTGSTLVTATPYDVTKLHFFDTTHLDRASTPWRFDDPDRTPYAEACRMATDFAASKGFGGARLTGHHTGERVGLLCLPVPGTTFIDMPNGDIAATAFPFDDINAAPWAQVGRAATQLAGTRGFGAGFFTGHKGSERHGWIGIDAGLVSVFDIDDRTVDESPEPFTDINAVDWAQAARLATDVCINLGFAGGFFTGHQVPGKRQIAALHLA